MMQTYKTKISSPVGDLELFCTDQGLRAMIFEHHKPGKVKLPNDAAVNALHPILREAEAQLSEYFAGTRQSFSVPLDLAPGTEFEQRVWASLLKIPYGSTMTYAQQAETFLGSRKSSRAVGLANSKNPVSIIIPCHRVVAANGDLQGYAGGLDVKAELLRRERAS